MANQTRTHVYSLAQGHAVHIAVHRIDSTIDDGLEGQQSAAARFRDLCDLQADSNVMASEKCATEDFGREWKQSKPQDRKRHYAAAMTMVCKIPDMESQRT